MPKHEDIPTAGCANDMQYLTIRLTAYGEKQPERDKMNRSLFIIMIKVPTLLRPALAAGIAGAAVKNARDKR